MDFEQFVAQYQKRTAKRMADFEALMKETQQKMEMTAKHHARARETMPRQPVTVQKMSPTLAASRMGMTS